MTNNLKILLVEDNSDNSTLFTYLLNRVGYTVTAVTSSEDALKALETLVPDIILCDISLPGENGHGLLKRIRSHSAFQNTCAIAVSAYAREEDKIRCKETGYDDFIEKPIEATSFAQQVTSIYERKKSTSNRSF
jgi:CheY-like chemotaxis protein